MQDLYHQPFDLGVEGMLWLYLNKDRVREALLLNIMIIIVTIIIIVSSIVIIVVIIQTKPE